MEKIKSYLNFTLKLAIGFIILNAILELIGNGVSDYLYNPIASVKKALGK